MGPLSQDGVVYESHSYEPEETGQYGYSQSNLPVIIGEYGPAGGASTLQDKSLFSKLEEKSISTLAWDFSPLSNCAPDLTTTDGSMARTALGLGNEVKTYLQAHALGGSRAVCGGGLGSPTCFPSLGKGAPRCAE
jgi:hypothetical protein